MPTTIRPSRKRDARPVGTLVQSPARPPSSSITNAMLNLGFTAGSIMFVDSTGNKLGQDNTNLFWDNSLKHLGLGPLATADDLTAGGTPIRKGLAFRAADSGGTQIVYAGVFGRIVSNVAGSASGELYFSVRDDGTHVGVAKFDQNGAFVVDPGAPSGVMAVSGQGERISSVERDNDDARPIAARNLKGTDLASLTYRAGYAYTIKSSTGTERALALTRAAFRTRTDGAEDGRWFLSLLRAGAEKDVLAVYDQGDMALVSTGASTGGNEVGTTLFPTDAYNRGGGKFVVLGTAGNGMLAVGDDTTPAGAGNGPYGLSFFARTTSGTGNAGRVEVARITGLKALAASGDHTGEMRFFATNAAGTSTHRMTLDASGNLVPAADGGGALGTAALSWGEVRVAGDVFWDSGTAFTGQFAHAITAARVWTFPDIEGTVALLDGTQTFGGAKTFSATLTASGQLTIGGALDHDGASVGFYGVAPVARPAAYVQNYGTTNRTANALLAADPGALVGTNVGPWGFSSQADFNTLVAAVRNLVSDVANIKQVQAQNIDDLQANGLFQ